MWPRGLLLVAPAAALMAAKDASPSVGGDYPWPMQAKSVATDSGRADLQSQMKDAKRQAKLARLGEEQERRDRVWQQLRDAQQQLRETSEQLDRDGQQLTADAKNQQELGGRVKVLEVENERLAVEKEVLHGKADQLAKELEKEKRLQASIAQLTQWNQGLLASSAAQQQQVQNATRQLEIAGRALAAKESEYRAAAAARDSLGANLSRSASEVARLTSERGLVQGQLQRVTDEKRAMHKDLASKLDAQMHASEAQISQLMTENQRLKAESGMLKVGAQQHAMHQKAVQESQVGRLQEAIQQLQAEKSGLLQNKADIEAQQLDLQGKLQKMATESSQVMAAATAAAQVAEVSADKRVADLLAQKQALYTEMQQVLNQSDNQKVQIARLRQQAFEEKAALTSSMQQQVAALREESRNYQQMLTERTGQLEVQNATDRQLFDEIVKLRASRKDLRESLSSQARFRQAESLKGEERQLADLLAEVAAEKQGVNKGLQDVASAYQEEEARLLRQLKSAVGAAGSAGRAQGSVEVDLLRRFEEEKQDLRRAQQERLEKLQQREETLSQQLQEGVVRLAADRAKMNDEAAAMLYKSAHWKSDVERLSDENAKLKEELRRASREKARPERGSFPPAGGPAAGEGLALEGTPTLGKEEVGKEELDMTSKSVRKAIKKREKAERAMRAEGQAADMTSESAKEAKAERKREKAERAMRAEGQAGTTGESAKAAKADTASPFGKLFSWLFPPTPTPEPAASDSEDEERKLVDMARAWKKDHAK